MSWREPLDHLIDRGAYRSDLHPEGSEPSAASARAFADLRPFHGLILYRSEWFAIVHHMSTPEYITIHRLMKENF